MNKKLLLSFVFYVIVFFTLYDYSVSENNCELKLQTFKTEISNDSFNAKTNRLDKICNTSVHEYEWYTAANNLRLKYWFYMLIYVCMLIFGLIEIFIKDKTHE